MSYYEEEFKKLGVDPTQLQKAHAARLEKADELCKECMAQPGKMLCNGVRPYYMLQQSQYYKVPKIETMACVKLIDQQREANINKKLLASGVPAGFRGGINPHDYADTFLLREQDIWFVGPSKGTVAIPLRGKVSVKTSPVPLYHIVLGAIMSGKNAKFLHPTVGLSTFRDRRGDFLTYYGECDWLVVENTDSVSAADYMRSLFVEMVQYRVDLGLPTLVRLSDNPRPLNDAEARLYTELKNWKTFKV